MRNSRELVEKRNNKKQYIDIGEGGDHCVQPPGCPRGKIAIYMQYILF